MKKQTLLLLAVFISCTALAQNVGIGTTTPDASAQLDVSGTTKGILIPRMNMIQRDAIAAPATGLLIFQTDNTPGFYYYTGTAWAIISGSGNTGWSLTGNAGTDSLTHFVGTTDNQPLVFKINNARTGFLGNNGNIFWGKGSGNGNTTGYANIAIGSGALFSNTDGKGQVAIGDSTLYYNTGHTYNTAIGGRALYSNTTGYENSALGYRSLLQNTTGNDNTGSGYQTLFRNTTGNSNTATGSYALFTNREGNENTASGFKALFSNETGNFNTATGSQTLLFNSTGSGITANGYQALFNNTTGMYNVAVGASALFSNTTGSDQVAIGKRALYSNSTGSYNSATGSGALIMNTTGDFNTANGFQSLLSNTTGAYNAGFGSRSLYSNTTGNNNTACGFRALYSTTTGYDNTASGEEALYYNTTGNNNTVSGKLALYSNTEGYNNTAIGIQALGNLKTGHDNTAIGYRADVGVNGAAFYNTTAIGSGAFAHANNMVRVGNGAVTVIEGAVFFSHPSDARFKYNIKANVPGLDFITKLKPVTYYFDAEKLANFTKTGIIDNINTHTASYTGERELKTGFLAQDVEKAANQLGYHFDGVHKPENDHDHYSLGYSQFVVPLVKAVQEQQQEIEKQNDDIELLKTRVAQLTKALEALTDK